MADIKIRVGTAVLNTSTGTQDLTISGFGTPKGIMIFSSHATADGTPIDHAAIGMSYADDQGNAGYASCASDHNVGTSATARRREEAGTLHGQLFPDGGTSADWAATIDSDDVNAGPITDGWRIDITGTNGNARRIGFILFGGADLTFEVWGGSASDATITVGFEPDVVMCNGPSVPSSAAAHCIMGQGFSDGTTHRALHYWDRDNLATSECGAILQEDGCYGLAFQDAVQMVGQTDTYTSTTFDISITEGSNGGGYEFTVAAMDFGGNSHWIGTLSAPTSAAADWTVTDPGFQPQAVIAFGALNTAVETIQGTNGGTFFCSALDKDGGAFCVSYSSEDGVGTTNTQSLFTSQWFDVPGDAGAQQFDIDPASSPFNADGWTVDAADIGAANATQRYWIGLAFEDQDAGGSLPPASFLSRSRPLLVR